MKAPHWFILLTALTLAGCHRNQSETIDTSMLSAPTSPQAEESPQPQPTAPPDISAASIAQPPGPTAPSPIAYQLPPGWSQQPGTDMRFATLTAPDHTQIAITVFPGDVGGELANINRWRRQMDLPAVTQATLNQSVTAIQTPAGPAILADLSNKDQRMLAVLLPSDNQTWFFKMEGTAKTVQQHLAEFNAIVQSIHRNAP